MSEGAKSSELITLREAAEYSGFSYRYLVNLAGKGRLTATKMGMQWFTTRADVDRYIDSRKKRGSYREDIRT